MFDLWKPTPGYRIKPPKPRGAVEPTFRLPTPPRKESNMKKIACKCLECNGISAHTGDGQRCPSCCGPIVPIGQFVESNRNTVTVNIKASGLTEIEEALNRINKLAKDTFAMR